MLKFYGYYKQATLGPCDDAKPSFWDVVKRAKWEAWHKLGNMSPEEAMRNYVDDLKQVDTYIRLVLNCTIFSYSKMLSLEKLIPIFECIL